MGENGFVARPYGLDDVFKGALNSPHTMFTGIPFTEWMEQRGLSTDDFRGRIDDLQAAPVFPLTESVEELGVLLRWMTTEPDLAEGRALWLNSKKFSADEISARANLQRLYAQRTAFRRGNWQALSTNYEKSVFCTDVANAQPDVTGPYYGVGRQARQS